MLMRKGTEVKEMMWDFDNDVGGGERLRLSRAVVLGGVSAVYGCSIQHADLSVPSPFYL